MNNRASVLIITIWVLSILSIFAVYVTYALQQRIAIAVRLQDSENLHYAAEAGIRSAVVELKEQGYRSSFQGLNHFCLDNEERFKDIPLGSAANFMVSYQGIEPQTGTPEQKYGFIDEQSKINLNTAPQFVLSRLLQRRAALNKETADGIANAIVDYRDVDTTGPNGVPEDFIYMSENGAVIKNSQFELVEEINTVPLITPDIARALIPYVTVFGSGTVNINTASIDTLEILGLDRELARKVFLFRCGADMLEGTADDNLVSDIDFYMSKIIAAAQLSAQEKDTLKNFLSSGLVSTASTCVFVNSTGRIKNKNKVVNIQCVYDLSGKVIYWNEMARSS